MRVLGAMIAGAIAALVGAAIWTAVGYFANLEVGWLAWGIGVLAGTAVFVGSGRNGDASLGILAVLLALAGILVGKWGVAYVSVQAFLNSDDGPISAVADQVIYERMQAGQRWPIAGAKSPDAAESVADMYPPTVWSEALERWFALTESERQLLRDAPNLSYPEYHLTYMCDQMLAALPDGGAKLAWPQGSIPELAFYKDDYPQALWKEAEERWNAMPASEQQSYRDAIIVAERQMRDSLTPQWQQDTVMDVFKSSFSPFDGLWAILAVASAFKIGSASAPKEGSAAPPAA